MLRELNIKNLAIIDEVRLEFSSGLNILSGETGAGKSIILNSIFLILGARSDSEMIRAGKDQGMVEATFEIENNESLSQRLDNHGIHFDTDEPLVIKRVLSRNGRNKIYINGQLANKTILGEITQGLVDISSQHEFHRLMDPNSHLSILDSYGELNELKSEYQTSLKAMQELLKKIQNLSMNEAERVRQMDFLKYQIQEIEDVHPQENENAFLEKEIKKIKRNKERQVFIEESEFLLREKEESISSQVNSLLDKATDLTSIDENFDSVRRCLENAAIQIEEASQELINLSRTLDADDQQLEELEDRLHEIKTLMRKYGPEVQDILNYLTKAQGQYHELEEREENLEIFQKELQDIRGQALHLGQQLTQKRKRISKVFKDSVEAELKDLGLLDAKLEAVFESSEEKEIKFKNDGIHSMLFHIALNKGEPPKPLAKYTSGGELSRILLSMKNVIAGKGEISVYLFDEVDAGIGGKTALQVGEKLSSVAHHNQVICITHLPQVAAFADKHFQVSKFEKDGRTTSRVMPLATEEKTQELIRMVGGEELGDAAHKHAEELFKMAEKKKVQFGNEADPTNLLN
jgi:DNA repair protein RecN (Recombination protein N)